MKHKPIPSHGSEDLKKDSFAGKRWARPRAKESAFTFVELTAVLAAICLLTILAVPVLANSRAHSDRAICRSNLHKIGRAFLMWADDHEGKFPFLVPTSEGGNNDHVLGNNVWFQYYWVREELNTPRVLVCPSDGERHPASDWSTSPDGGFLSPNQRNQSCSYLLALSAIQVPRGLLSADRNIPPSSAFSASCPSPFGGNFSLDWQSPTLDWTEALHSRIGNIVLNDGSVLSADQEVLRTAVQMAVRPGNRYLCTLYP